MNNYCSYILLAGSTAEVMHGVKVCKFKLGSVFSPTCDLLCLASSTILNEMVFREVIACLWGGIHDRA